MFFDLFWLFLLYSVAGWLAETVFSAVRWHKFVNRGILNGPLCAVYGFTAVVLTVVLQDIRPHLFWLFLFSAVYATVIEWVAGHLLEKTSHGRWWDYSGVKFNLDGYICVPYSLLWGLLGMAAVQWVNPLLLQLYRMVPRGVMHIALWICFGVLAVDAAGTFAVIFFGKIRSPRVAKANSRLAELTRRLGHAIAAHVERRIAKAHPKAKESTLREKPAVFAQGCGFYKLVLLFVIGSFLGDLVEMVFCYFNYGYWMNRSSLVWGPFSVVWGLALAAGTALLYRHRNRSDSFLFLFGTLVGGAYEYACSVFTEIVFGTVFWDYSHMAFNLGGRINLLFCFFWGVAAVVWLKLCYPWLSKQIEKIPVKPGKILTWALVVFMAVNMLVSAAALGRHTARREGVPPQNAVEVLLDTYFDDERMAWNYPKLRFVDNAEQK